MFELQSSEVNEIYPALISAQMDLQNPIKDTKGHNYKYADLAQVIELTREPLSKHGLAVMSLVTTMGDKTTLVTTLAHKSGQWIRSYYPIESAGLRQANDAQQTGASISYARRYSLQSLLNLAAEDDDDGQCLTPKNRHQSRVKPLSPANQQELISMAASKNQVMTNVPPSALGVQSLDNINAENFQPVKIALSKWLQDQE